MKILVVSDIVVPALFEQRYSAIDTIIACGDLPPEYLIRLRNAYDVPLYYVLGNHDIRYSTVPPMGCIPINRTMIEFSENQRLVGFSGSRWYNGQHNQYTEKEMLRYIKLMRFLFWRKGVPEIIAAHAPPRFIGDRADFAHRGFHAFRWLIERYKPRYFLHGHIHRTFDRESERFLRFHDTIIINCFGNYVLEI